MRPAPSVVAVAAGLVLAADLAVVATSATRPGAHRLASLPVPSSSDTAAAVVSASPTVTMAVPTATPTASVEPAVPVLTTEPVPAATAVARTTAPPARPPATSTRVFQGLYGPLPTGCLSYGHACEYSDARGPVTGGSAGVRATGAGPGAVTVTWWPSGVQWDPPPVGVVVRIVREWESRRLVVEHRDPSLRGSVTLSGLPEGTTVYAQAQELNSEGLSPGVVTEVVVPAAPSPSPSATSSASPTG